MSTLTFDKLAYLESLKAAGVPEGQARAHAMALDEALRDTVSTKADIRELELRMTVKFGSMLLVAVGIILTAMRFMLPL